MSDTSGQADAGKTKLDKTEQANALQMVCEKTAGGDEIVNLSKATSDQIRKFCSLAARAVDSNADSQSTVAQLWDQIPDSTKTELAKILKRAFTTAKPITPGSSSSSPKPSSSSKPSSSRSPVVKSAGTPTSAQWSLPVSGSTRVKLASHSDVDLTIGAIVGSSLQISNLGLDYTQSFNDLSLKSSISVSPISRSGTIKIEIKFNLP